MKEYPKVVVGSLIVNDEGDILLIKSYKWNNGDIYSIPGGHIELGETIEHAVKREIKEEVGLDVNLEKILFVQEAINPKEYHKEGKHFIFLECICASKSKQVKLDNKEMQDSIWTSPKKALDLELDQYTRKFILEYLERK